MWVNPAPSFSLEGFTWEVLVKLVERRRHVLGVGRTTLHF